MALPPIRLVGAQSPIIPVGGKSVVLIPNTVNIYGGFVINPSDAAGQGLDLPEPLYVSIAGPAPIGGVGTASELLPGQTFVVPGGQTVWANAASNGHRYTAMFGFPWEEPPPPEVIITKGWPPEAPTGLLSVMYAYAYQEYSDDDDVQAFFASLNAMQQDYVDTFNALRLPIYSNPLIVGRMADWVMEGIYGFKRPTLFAQRHHPIGPLNTYWPNFNVALNMLQRQPATDVHVANDDVYKRCLTWHFQKGDGKYFNVRWLKRRIWRFLIGENGTCPHIDNTDRISIDFGANFDATIRIIMGQRTVIGGALPNRFGPNGVTAKRITETAPPVNITPPALVGTGVIGQPLTCSIGAWQGSLPVVDRGPEDVPPNSIFAYYIPYPALPMAPQFQEAVAAGILELPFQFRFNVVIE